MNNEPLSADARFFRGFALAGAMSLAIWGGAGLGLISSYPQITRSAYLTAIRPALHQTRIVLQRLLFT